MSDWRICRICTASCDSRLLVKYGTRSYGHAKCLLGKYGVSILERLSLAVLEAFPVLSLRTYVADPLAHMEQLIERRNGGRTKKTKEEWSVER